jgi:hypothetical protein
VAKKGKQGSPKAPQKKSASESVEKKKTGARGARKTKLDDLQKILIANGGRNHSVLRRKKMDVKAPKRRGGKAAA